MNEETPLLKDSERSVEFQKSLSQIESIPSNVNIHDLVTFKDFSGEQSEAASAPMEIENSVRITKRQFFMQILRASVGTGVIALPSAMANAGLIFGMVGIFLVAIIAIHCVYLVVESAQFLRKRYDLEKVELDYGNTVKYAFKYGPQWSRHIKWTSKFLNASLIPIQFGICAIYILFISENIQYLVHHFAPTFNQPLVVYISMVTLIISPLIFVRSIRVLSYISGFGNILMFIALVLILICCWQDIPDVTQYPYITDIHRLPLFFGITIFCFGSITAVLPNESALDDKESLLGCCGLLNFSFGSVLIIYLTVAFYGYAKFGETVKGSITYSIPLTPWYFMIVKPIYALVIFITFGIQFFIFIEVIWHTLRQRITEKRWLRHVCALVSLVLMFCLASSVPHLEHIISFLGAFGGASLCLIFPALVHMMTFWEHQSSSIWFRLVVMENILIICFGIFGAIIGTYTSFLAIYEAF